LSKQDFSEAGYSIWCAGTSNVSTLTVISTAGTNVATTVKNRTYFKRVGRPEMDEMARGVYTRAKASTHA